MVVVVIVAILATIAIPAYTRYITHSRRGAAEACLSNYANFMERYYATNMDYSVKIADFPELSCAGDDNTGQYYDYNLVKAKSSDTTYKLQAKPINSQAKQDKKCGTLYIDQTGEHSVSGTANVSECWSN